MDREPLTLFSEDGLEIEAELCVPDEPKAVVVALHPHPMHNGSMNAIVPSEIMRTYPDHNIAVLRFNFRGVGRSQGSFEDGVGEVLDARAAVKAAHEILEGLPLVAVGSSFGADTAFSLHDDRIDAWVGSAPPLRDEKLQRFTAVANDMRPKLIVVAERDEYRNPAGVTEITKHWNSTQTVVIKGTTHFLVGRVQEAVATIRDFVLTVQPHKKASGNKSP